jgi:DNA-binding CsgD family transcriptional regulator
MNDELDVAIAAVLASTTPSGASVGAAHLHTIARTRLHGAPSKAGDELRYRAALVIALARDGRPEDAILSAEDAIAAAEAMAVVDTGELVDLLAAAAEAYATAGWPRRSAELAYRALSYADALAQDERVFRARSLLAVSLALNGEYAGAIAHARVCRQIAHRNTWATQVFVYPLILGEILIASARLDGAALLTLVRELRDSLGDDPLWAATADSAEGMALLISGDAARALPLLMLVINGTDSPGVLRMIRGFALGIYADVLLARGEARRVLGLLDGHDSPAGHALCFDMQRAAAHLLLHNDQAALLTTDACVSLGTEHCLRTIPPVLLRRAIAYQRLGRHTLADERFAEAFHLLAASGSSTPLLTLPTESLRELLDRFEQHHPDVADVGAIRVRLSLAPPVDVQRSTLPHLTERETRLAHRLRSAATLTEIATQLHVSLNTVKTQARSLYRKLDVNSRDEAIGVLQERGFFY